MVEYLILIHPNSSHENEVMQFFRLHLTSKSEEEEDQIRQICRRSLLKVAARGGYTSHLTLTRSGARQERCRLQQNLMFLKMAIIRMPKLQQDSFESIAT
ncbi:hypothetical protein JOB18_049390 [Solea senegalensis]|uniref:Uncharacterized protein n=1 Tax=Solea senegalensis TaxID=28829 RepID=A0AAV6Q223_SOLSE|nr:hypothetical protein JOB18_049390 [Solea senegalensis]